MKQSKLKNFYLAFDDGGYGCHSCNCGKTYYDPRSEFEDDEFEKLQKSKKAFTTGKSVSVVRIKKSIM